MDGAVVGVMEVTVEEDHMEDGEVEVHMEAEENPIHQDGEEAHMEAEEKPTHPDGEEALMEAGEKPIHRDGEEAMAEAMVVDIVALEEAVGDDYYRIIISNRVLR